MKRTLIILAVLLLVIAGCTSTTQPSTRSYRTGNSALEMRVLQQGVTDVYEGDPFEVLIEFFNRGTTDIANGEFFVSGFDLNFMRLSLDPKFINIPGKSQFDPEGRNSQILVIRGTNVRLPANSDRFDQNIKVTACYDYTSFATADICVDPDPNGRRVTRQTCTMTPVSPGPQGHPVVVTRVEPIVSRNDFRLNIEFANQGGGIVYDRSLTPQQCFMALDAFQDKDRVHVVRVDFGGRALTCTPSGAIRLIDGRGRVSCTCTNCIAEYMDAFRTQVSIELDYGYRNEITKSVRVLEG
ncbi:MAG: hypothetical protein ACMXYK_00425 [Candidatus Woesearchaeota archaeon]